jgi:hypothetical protein
MLQPLKIFKNFKMSFEGVNISKKQVTSYFKLLHRTIMNNILKQLEN